MSEVWFSPHPYLQSILRCMWLSSYMIHSYVFTDNQILKFKVSQFLKKLLQTAFFFFFNFILFLNFTILYWFCQISKWIRHRYTYVPHPEPSSLFPPHTIPLGRPSAPAPSIQYRASNLDWRLISYMILYVFQCHSPNTYCILDLCWVICGVQVKISLSCL